MVGKTRFSISRSPMMAPNSSIVGHNSTPLERKRLIHPYLMVWKDTRKIIGGDRVLAIRTKHPNPS